MVMPVPGPLVAQCLLLDPEEECTRVVHQHPDQVVLLQMHLSPLLVHLDSLPCQLVVRVILTEDLPAQDKCIQEHRLDGLQDSLVPVHMVDQVQHHHMVHLLVDQDPDHMVHNTVLVLGQTPGLELRDREQDHLTDPT